jgi:RNA polymerase sigma-70 factor (ECF subfamily)
MSHSVIQQDSDARLTDRAVRGELQSGFAPRELDRHRPQLMKFALMQLPNVAAAEDAVQETLLAALRSGESFAGQSAVKTWLVGILKYKIVDTIRRQSREQPLDIDEGDTSLEECSPFQENGRFEEPLGQWSDPETALTQRRFFEVVERVLEDLPKRTARVFKMREVIGLETEEICATLGIAQSNCWVMLHRARAALRAGLEQQWFGGKRCGADVVRSRNRRIFVPVLRLPRCVN